MTSRLLRQANKLLVPVVIVVVSSCGATEVEKSASGEPASTTGRAPEAIEVAVTAQAVSAADDLEAQVESAIVQLRGTAADDDAAFLVGNLALHRHVSACMAAEDLTYPDFLFAAGLPGPMRSVRAYSLAWPSPPDETLARTVGLEPVHPSDPPIPLSVPPNDFYESLDSAGQTRYDATQSKCEASYVPPSNLAAAGKLSESIVASFQSVEAATLLNPSFAPVQEEYVSCMSSRGLSVEAPDGLRDLLDNARGELSGQNTVDDQKVIESKGIELAVADAECRAPLYGQFLSIDATAWKDWAESSSSDLKELDNIRAQIRDEAARIG
jgi:hypothetical protein